MRKSAGWAACLFALAAPALGEASVFRDGEFAYVMKRADIEPGPPATHAAKCPNGTRVLSGGSYNTGSYDTAVVNHSFPFDTDDRDRHPDDGWKIQWSTNAEVAIRTYAVCAERAARYPQGESTAHAGTSINTGVTCPGDRFAYSGGTSGPKRAFEVVSLTPDGSYWRVPVEQVDGPDTQVELYAVCSRPDATIVEADDLATSSTQRTETAICPDGSRVVGGGMWHEGFAADEGMVRLATSYPVGYDSPSADGWEVQIDNYYSAHSVAMHVQALCLPV